MAKADTTTSNDPMSGRAALRLWSTTSTSDRSANRVRAASSMAGEKSRPTPGAAISAGGCFDDVGRDPPTRHLHAVRLELDDHVTQRIDAAGDRRDVEVGETALDARRGPDRLARGVDHAVTLRRRLQLLATAA